MQPASLWMIRISRQAFVAECKSDSRDGCQRASLCGFLSSQNRSFLGGVMVMHATVDKAATGQVEGGPHPVKVDATVISRVVLFQNLRIADRRHAALGIACFLFLSFVVCYCKLKEV